MTKFDDNRPIRPALWRGLKCKCPRCGQGAALYKYLKVKDQCANCGQDLHHHRADDGPAYLTILLVGHIIAPILHISYSHFSPEPWMIAVGLSFIAVVMSLLLLPRIKGGIVAFQWARRMGGFGHEATAAEGPLNV